MALGPDTTPLRFSDAAAMHKSLCRDLITSGRHRRVCEIGGGRSPLFRPEEIEELGVEYTIMDVDQDELDHAPPGYRAVWADICDPTGPLSAESFDFMFSKMVAEHVPDARRMHETILRALRPGGHVFHFFPTLYHPIFVANRLFPEALARRLLDRFDRRSLPKFPARYSWCHGPSVRSIGRLHAMGWQVERYHPVYGTDYLERLPVARELEVAMSAWAERRRNPHLAAYAFLVLRKP